MVFCQGSDNLSVERTKHSDVLLYDKNDSQSSAYLVTGADDKKIRKHDDWFLESMITQICVLVLQLFFLILKPSSS